MHPLLVEGLTDAIGFVIGCLLGFGLGRLLGLDIFAQGYGNATIAGILLIGAGGGGGVQLARRWQRLRAAKKNWERE